MLNVIFVEYLLNSCIFTAVDPTSHLNESVVGFYWSVVFVFQKNSTNFS